MSKFDITIAGEINLDLILYRLPQELPTERNLLDSGLTVTLGSSSEIPAHNLGAPGSRIGFIGKIGNDPLGRLALERTLGEWVDVSCVVERKKQPRALFVESEIAEVGVDVARLNSSCLLVGVGLLSRCTWKF